MFFWGIYRQTCSLVRFTFRLACERYDLSTPAGGTCSVSENCAWNTFSKCPRIYFAYLFTMIVQPNPRPPVPGTRKRGGAKNLPVKKKKIQNINNKKTTIATWNVRTMNDDGKLDQLLNEMTRFKIDILGA